MKFHEIIKKFPEVFNFALNHHGSLMDFFEDDSYNSYVATPEFIEAFSSLEGVADGKGDTPFDKRLWSLQHTWQNMLNVGFFDPQETEDKYLKCFAVMLSMAWGDHQRRFAAASKLWKQIPLYWNSVKLFPKAEEIVNEIEKLGFIHLNGINVREEAARQMRETREEAEY